MNSNGIWDDDLLNRRAVADLVIRFLAERFGERTRAGVPGSYVLNVTAEWGRGKTFLERLDRQLKNEGFISCYVNSWRDDASGEPLIAVMSAIEHALSPYLAARKDISKMWSNVKESGGEALAILVKSAGKRFLARHLGTGVDEILALAERDREISEDSLENDAEQSSKIIGDASAEIISELANKYLTAKIDAYKQRANSAETFKQRMSRLLLKLESLGKVKLPMFMIIDELDRCRPTYSIETLEQIKHLFDASGIVFVIATDSDQLQSSIKAVYGSEFNSQAYLNRFFNRRHQLPEADIIQFINFMFNAFPIDLGKVSTPENIDPAEYFRDAITHLQLSLRDSEQCYDIVRSFITLWDEPVPVEFLYLVPMAIAYQSANQALEDGLTKSNAQWSQILKGNAQWRVPNFRLDRNTGHSSPTPIEMTSVLGFYNSLSHKTLRSILESGFPDDTVKEHIQTQLRREYKLRFNNTSVRGKEPYSLLNTYMARIRALADFSAHPLPAG